MMNSSKDDGRETNTEMTFSGPRRRKVGEDLQSTVITWEANEFHIGPSGPIPRNTCPAALLCNPQPNQQTNYSVMNYCMIVSLI